MIKRYGAAAVMGDRALDVGLMHRIDVLRGVFAAVSRLNAATHETIHHLSDADREILAQLRTQGLL